MTTAWPEVRLGDVVVEARPGFASGHDLDEGIFQFRMNNLTRDGHFDLSKRRRVPSDTKKIDSFLLRPGDVLFNATNSPELVGKSAYIGDLDEPAVFSNHFLRIRVDTNRIAPRFLWRWLQLQLQQGLFRSRARQWVNQAAYGREALVELQIPLPPIDEQRRIAAVLDQADELRAKRQRTAVLLDVLVESIFLEMFGHPAENPNKLPTTTLGELAEWRSGGTPPRSEARFFRGSVPWFSSGELGPVFIESSAECISEEAILETSAKDVSAGSLMLGMYDTAALKSSIAMQRCSCNQAVAFASIPTDVASTRFVHAAIQVGRDFYRSKQRGVRQKNLNLSIVRSFEIPLPSIEDQARFESLTRAVDSQSRRASDHATMISDLRSSLQHRAFAGQL